MKKNVLLVVGLAFISLSAFNQQKNQSVSLSDDSITTPQTNPKLPPSVKGVKTLTYGEDDTRMNCNDAGGKISFDVAGSEKMNINNNGNVGIGTTSPTSTFHIIGGNYAWQPLAEGTQIFGGGIELTREQYPYIDFNANTLGQDYDSRLILNGGSTSQIFSILGAPVGINYTTYNSNYRLSVGGNSYFSGNAYVTGNIGIGTTSPSKKLHVVGDSYFNGNVGIGTSTPSTCLSIKAPNFTDILTIETSDYPTWNPTWKLNYMDGHLLFKFSENGGAFMNTFSISRFGDIGLVCPGTNRRIDISTSSQCIDIWDDNNIKKVSISTGSILLSQKLEIRTDLNMPGTAVMKITSDGKIWAQEVLVQSSDPWPDYVFESNYKAMSLNDLEFFVKTNKHLPDVPSASNISENGVNLAKMDASLLQKVEELTLYVIDLNKNLAEQNKRIESLESENKELRNQLLNK